MTDQWEQILNEVTKLCDFEEYMRQANKSGIEEREHEWFAHDYVNALPLLLLTVGSYRKVLTLPGSDLSSMTNDLRKLWEAIFDKIERQQGDYDDLDEPDEEELEEEEEFEDNDEFEDDDEFEEGEILTPEEAFSNELHALQDKTDGILACLESYTANDTPDNASPNELLQQAISISWSNSKKARRLFGQASAAILRGAAYWPLWSLEVKDTLLDGWWPGVLSLESWFTVKGRYPLGEIAQERIRFASKPEANDINNLEEDKFDETELSPEAQRLTGVLFSGDEDYLSDEQLASLNIFTPEIFKLLNDVITGPVYSDDTAPDGGWAPIRAAQLLGKSRSGEAAVPLLKGLYLSDPLDELFSACIYALQAVGSPAFSAVADSLRFSSSEDFKLGLAEVMGKIGQGDERAYPILERYYQETKWIDDRGMAVSAIVKLGDRRAIPLLYKTLEERDITAMGINEVVDAIMEIDPNYDPNKLKHLETKARQRYDKRSVSYDKSGKPRCPECGSLVKKNSAGEWIHVQEQPRFQTLPPQYKNVGRNDPCPCGSGKKFKHCHGSGKVSGD